MQLESNCELPLLCVDFQSVFKPVFESYTALVQDQLSLLHVEGSSSGSLEVILDSLLSQFL